MVRPGPSAGGRPPVATPARLAAALGHRLPPRAARIGLLGGSFNPAHGGHLHISREALKRLNLDEVWWLVAPQNPLKAQDCMAPLAERLQGARGIAKDRRIRVSPLEALLGTERTAASLALLTGRLPGRRFVWLMGADNMIGIDRWHDWPRIFALLPVAVLARPSYSVRASSSKAAVRLRKGRLPEVQARRLADWPTPAWVLLRCRLSSLSATKLRQARKG
ncbi:MAG: nicotinate-nucleotide adenylyltransferase [Rhodospirillales bacterium]|nr:nicotinate-nucleotide adenylyltransferase [Rhodospirillales bacterium]